ncbi:MAG: hypothetical protein JNK45_35450 [Myxococcales bacterium]|nr:hypothetical protein [Myxococcales bacterium]
MHETGGGTPSSPHDMRRRLAGGGLGTARAWWFRRAPAMTDLLLIAATIAFFAASATYLRVCTRL